VNAIALLWLLFVVPLLLSFAAGARVQRVFERYRAVPNHAGVTGAEVARALLDAHGLQAVRLQLLPGTLTDQYDPDRHVVGLSDSVARERSVASMGIAAHEVSHVYQDAEGNRAYRARRVIGEPLMRLAPWSGMLFVGGFWLGIPALIVLSLVYACGLVVFAIATVPVEAGASRRAMDILRRTGLADDREADGVGRVLRAAAVTYVVGVLRQLALFAALLAMAEAIVRAGSG
jgi:Zn-dependent membrane protease YugP